MAKGHIRAHLSNQRRLHRLYLAKKERAINNPFHCLGCHYKTTTEEKMVKHVEKFAKIYTHPQVPNPHEMVVRHNDVEVEN